MEHQIKKEPAIKVEPGISGSFSPGINKVEISASYGAGGSSSSHSDNLDRKSGIFEGQSSLFKSNRKKDSKKRKCKRKRGRRRQLKRPAATRAWKHAGKILRNREASEEFTILTGIAVNMSTHLAAAVKDEKTAEKELQEKLNGSKKARKELTLIEREAKKASKNLKMKANERKVIQENLNNVRKKILNFPKIYGSCKL